MTEALARLTTRLADPPVSDPANPAAPPVLSQTAHVGWRDQVVIAVGLAQSFTDRLTAYGGFNYGRNPAPRDTLTPLLAPIGEYYVTGGLAYRITDGWAASGAFGIPASETRVVQQPELSAQPRRGGAYQLHRAPPDAEPPLVS
jgi:long-subunit fatty acid transport protein